MLTTDADALLDAPRLPDRWGAGSEPSQRPNAAVSSLADILKQRSSRGLTSPVHGAALVLFSEATVAWHDWGKTDFDTAQRLAVNCALKDLIWSSATRAAYTKADEIPVVDIEVGLHHFDGRADGTWRSDTTTVTPLWHGVWLLSPCRVEVRRESISDNDPTEHAVPFMCCGEPSLGGTSGVQLRWQADRRNLTDATLILAELRVHRMVRTSQAL